MQAECKALDETLARSVEKSTSIGIDGDQKKIRESDEAFKKRKAEARMDEIRSKGAAKFAKMEELRTTNIAFDAC